MSLLLTVMVAGCFLLLKPSLAFQREEMARNQSGHPSYLLDHLSSHAKSVSLFSLLTFLGTLGT